MVLTEQSIVETKFVLQLDEFISFRRSFFLGKPAIRRYRIMGVLALILYVLVFGVLMSMDTPKHIDLSKISFSEILPQLMGALFGLFLLVIYPIIILPMLINVGAKKHYFSNNAIRNEQHFEFFDEGFTVKNESGYSNIKWQDVFKVVETKEGFAIFTSDIIAFLIPKRSLSQPQSFKNLLTRTLPLAKLEIKK